MSLEGQSFYPGEAATPAQIGLLAGEYRRAADALLQTCSRGEPLSHAPYRLLALHAIELYLNAVLVAAGYAPAKLRALHHDLGTRTELALAAKLDLRKRTITHLLKMSETREYLASRYDPLASVTSELNRISATLHEVANKAMALIERPIF